MELDKAYIFDIQRYCVQDGPGIRTSVFFKGCPLKCIWCSNPESQVRAPQLMLLRNLCTDCGRCVEACPTKANQVMSDGSRKVDRNLCQVCGKCVEACLAEARKITGKLMTLREVFEIVMKDAPFYENSGGGVTATGGEPTSQPAFLLSLFRECRKSGVHTALETCGFVKWKVLKPILEHVDLVLFDVKKIALEGHRQLTGESNELILENARRIVGAKTPLIMRVPLIPGCNDSEEDIRAFARFALDLGGPEINLLPYHKLGLNKYTSLDLEYKLKNAEPYEDGEIEFLAGLIRLYGLTVKIS